MGYRIFFSHSHRDEALARLIKAQVEALGDVSIFLFQDHMEPGQPSYQKIQAAIEQSHALLALVTSNSAPSPNVHQEIGYSLGQRKVTVALVLPDADKAALAMLQPLDYIALDPADPLPGMTKLMEFVVAQRKLLDASEAATAPRPIEASARVGIDLHLEKDELVAALVLVCAAILIVYAMQKTSTA